MFKWIKRYFCSLTDEKIAKEQEERTKFICDLTDEQRGDELKSIYHKRIREFEV